MTELIPNAETMKTTILLGNVLTHLNADQRAMFYVSRGRGEATVQCLRVMLSRVRNNLRAKSKRVKHFKLHADVIPWTLVPGSNIRMDCVILSRSRTGDHEVLETLEEMMAANG